MSFSRLRSLNINLGESESLEFIEIFIVINGWPLYRWKTVDIFCRTQHFKSNDILFAWVCLFILAAMYCFKYLKGKMVLLTYLFRILFEFITPIFFLSFSLRPFPLFLFILILTFSFKFLHKVCLGTFVVCRRLCLGSWCYILFLKLIRCFHVLYL